MCKWSHFDFGEVKLICPREPSKVVQMQLRYNVYQNHERKLSPFMNCHNEYGLSQCSKCKSTLYDYMLSLNEETVIDKPIDLHVIFE